MKYRTPTLFITMSLFAQVATAAETGNEWTSFFGRLHPMILHLPIGFLILAFLLEVVSKMKKFNHLGQAVGFTLVLGTASAALAGLFGYFLSEEGGYAKEALNLHKWAGFSLIGLSTILMLVKLTGKWKRISMPLFFVMMVVLTATGHFGGSLTHGEDYLTSKLPEPLRTLAGIQEVPSGELQVNDINEALVFEDLVQPLLKDKCLSCHNTSKTKGDLQMHTRQALLAGGKSGPLFIEGNGADSRLVHRVSLPIDHDDRMPPDGKTGLSASEIQLLRWWIDEGADFEKSVNDLQATVPVRTILDSIQTALKKRVHPVYVKSLANVDQDDLEALMEMGISVRRLSQDQPFLEARVPGFTDEIDDMLGNIREQLVWLDLARSNVNDELLSGIGSFPNLVRLKLQNTEVTNEGLVHLEELDHLEHLNLYNTKIDDAAIPYLSTLKSLKSLYLWQTQITDAGVDALKSALPDTRIDKGLPTTALDTVRLAAPILTVDRALFKTIATAELTLGFPGVGIYYTLDGSPPDDTDRLYSGPITIDKSCTLRAVAIKDGWGNSDEVTMEFIKVRYLAEKVSLSYEASESYAGNGPITLIDSKKGSQNFRDGNWLGFHEVDLIADLDMGELADVQRVTLSCLEDIGSYIFFPRDITVSISTDGYSYQQVGNLTLQVPTSARPGSLKNFSFDFETQRARYIKVAASSVGRCPDWHPGAGDKAWIFADEIIIE